MPQRTHDGRAACRRRRRRRNGRAASPAVGYDVETLEGRRLLAFSATGPEFPVNVFTAGQQANPAVAADGDGDFVVTWESAGQDGDNFGIYARRYDAAGVAQQVPGAPADTTEFRVNTPTAGSQAGAAVAMDADGDFVVVWRHFEQNGAVVGIYARRYDAAGVVQGPDFLVNTTTTTAGQGAPTVATNVRGEFVVAWQGFGQDGDGTGIYARLFDAAGAARGDEFRVNTYTTSDQRFPSAAMDAEGDFAIAWQSIGQDGPASLGVYAQRYTAAGEPRGAEFRVNTTTASNQSEASIAMDANGDFVVAWSEGYTGEYVSEYNVRAQRFDASGAAQGGELVVNTHTDSPQRFPAAAMDADGDFLVTWESDGQDGSGNGVYGQLYTAAGLEVGDEFRANSHTLGAQRGAAVAIDPDGDAVAAWVSSGQDGSGYGVYAQRYNQSDDTAGPVASGLSADGNAVGPGYPVPKFVTSLAVQFSEDLSVVGGAGGAGGANSATNRANYRLTRDGADVSPLITAVSFAFNPATRKYEAALTLSAQLTSASYVLTVREALRDAAAGNALDGNLDGIAGGGDAALPFVVHDVAPVGGEFQVNVTTPGVQHLPAVATDADGDFVVAWHGADALGSGYGIFARRYNAAGVAQQVPGAAPDVTEFQVFRIPGKSVSDPSVAMDADGDFVIAWQGYGLEGDASGIYAKRYNAAGVAQQVPSAPGVFEFRVNLTFANTQSDPTVAMDADGDFVVAWVSRAQDFEDTRGVYARRYNAAGVPQDVPNTPPGTSEFRVNASRTGDQVRPSAAMDADGDFVVAWSGSGTGDASGAFARRYDAAGVPQVVPGNMGDETQFRVNTTVLGSQFGPSAAMDADGDFVITWEGASDSDDPAGIYAKRYNSAGVAQDRGPVDVLAGQFRVNVTTDGEQSSSWAAMDADGDFVVVWQSYGQDGSFDGVYARRFDAAGQPDAAPGAPAGAPAEFRVNTTTISRQLTPAAAMDAEGDFVVAWASYGQDRSDPPSYGVYAQRYGPNQSPTAFGIAPVLAQQDQADTVRDLWAAFDDPNTADATLSFTVVSNTNPGLFSSTPVSNAVGTLTLDYAAGQSGQATLTVRATDPGGLFVDSSFNVTVTPAGGATPRVAAVYIDGSAWQPAFRQFLQTSGAGSSTLGFRIDGGAAQLDELPWSNANRVHVVFSEDVTVTADDLVVRGVNTAAYALDGAAFAYAAGTFTATWTLANNVRFANDKVLLDLNADAGGVTGKAAAGALDGEWANGISAFPSGNAAVGGDFRFQLNFLPGDVNRNGGVVNSLDVQQARLRQFTSPANAGTPPNTYTAFHDVDGSAFMNALDVQQVRIRQFSQLPGGNPALATFRSDLFARTAFGRGRPEDELEPLM